MIKIENVSFPDNARIIAISDIHGMYHVLDKLLKKIEYNKNIDFLFLLGDFSQWGIYPLKTLRYIMELSQNKRVYAVLGNHDYHNYKIFLDKYLDNDFSNYLNKPKTLLYDMYEEYKMHNQNYKTLDLKDLQIELRKYFNKELTFLEKLPLMIESDDFIFVHAGIDKIRNYRQSCYQTVSRKRYFYFQGHLADKIVICGHMPVSIYHKNEFDDNIIIDLKKKIISIDGGNVVKEGGQLNALVIIKNGSSYIYQSDYESGLALKILAKDSIGEFRGKGICWPNYELELLERQEYFSKVRIVSTDETTYIKNEYLLSDNIYAYDDCPASVLEIKKGESVEVINDSCKGYMLVKYHGKQGWIKKES